MNVNDVEQTVLSAPAFDRLGSASRVIDTVDEEGGHTPFEMVQTNELVPRSRPDTAALGLVTLLTLLVPVITDHEPEPADGVLAPSVPEAEQTV